MSTCQSMSTQRLPLISRIVNTVVLSSHYLLSENRLLEVYLSVEVHTKAPSSSMVKTLVTFRKSTVVSATLSPMDVSEQISWIKHRRALDFVSSGFLANQMTDKVVTQVENNCEKLRQNAQCSPKLKTIVKIVTN